MAPRVDFFFSPASRYSYLAATQIAPVERVRLEGSGLRHCDGSDDAEALLGERKP